MEENKEIPTTDGVTHDVPTKPPSIDEDAVVNKINTKMRESERPYHEIGKFLLDQYFDGDPKKARDRDPKKDVSFRKLAKRKDLNVSFSWLHKMVAVTVQDDLFEKKGIDATSVSYSIKVELLPLPDEAKITLIQEAVSGPCLSGT